MHAEPHRNHRLLEELADRCSRPGSSNLGPLHLGHGASLLPWAGTQRRRLPRDGRGRGRQLSRGGATPERDHDDTGGVGRSPQAELRGSRRKGNAGGRAWRAS